MNNRFIDVNKNDQISTLNKHDLTEILKEINKYYLTYRNSLNLPKELTFGVEIEYEKAKKEKVDLYVENNLPEWISKYDLSLFSGGEINSPIMNDEIKYWEELKKICHYLKVNGAKKSKNAGGHIHIGAHILGNDINSWRNFLKLYTIYEDILYRFGYGDYINGRKELNHYAKPFGNNVYYSLQEINNCTFVSNLTSFLPVYDKCYSLSLCTANFHNIDKFKERNTIEFRFPNSTTNEIIWQNNILTFSKLLLAAKKGNLDEELLDYKVKHSYKILTKNGSIEDKIDLIKAIELCDVIFDNNLDKTYFLRQYIKNYQREILIKRPIKARKFTK